MLQKIKELLFKAEGTKKTVVKNFLWLSLSQMGSRVIRTFITLYAARALGAAQYGVFSYALGLAGFFIFFKNIGVDAIMTREIAKDPQSRERTFSTGFWIEVVLLIVTVFLLVVVAPMFSKIDEAIILLPIVAIMFIADDLRDFFFAFFRGVEKMEWEAILVTVGNVLVTAFGFAALAYANTPFSLTVSYATASVFVTVIAGGIVFWRYGSGVVRKFSAARVLPILNAAWPMAVAAIPGLFLFNVDLVMLGWWRSASEVGIYAATQKVVGILAILPQLLATSVFPAFARFARQHDGLKTRLLIESVLRVLFVFSAPLVAGGSILGAPILFRVFGGEYVSGNVAFAILLLTVFATFPLMIFTNFIFAHDAQKKAVPYSFLSAFTNVGLNALLVPSYGMIGASFATLISFGIYVFCMYRLARSIEHFSFLPKVTNVIIAVAAMALITTALRAAGIDVIVNIIISAASYMLVLVALKEEAVTEVLGLLKK